MISSTIKNINLTSNLKLWFPNIPIEILELLGEYENKFRIVKSKKSIEINKAKQILTHAERNFLFKDPVKWKFKT